MSDSTDNWDPEEQRNRRIQEVAEDVAQRRAAGEVLPDDEVIAQHADLMPELGKKLKDLRAIVEQLEKESQEDQLRFAPGDKIHRYIVRRILGEGHFGTVYLGWDENLGRPVAIKVPRPERLAQESFVEQYLEEAHTVARLKHEGIVPIYDADRIDGSCYIVYEYFDGGDLHKLCRTRPTPREAADLIAHVAEALAYVHQHKIVHRDIKPANIFLDSKTGRPWLGDFGLALNEEDFGRGPTSPGTVPYMSPEQARGEGHLVDGRSDLFSLGVVFYELLTGNLPFTGSSWQEIVERIKTLEVRPLRQLDNTIPIELERICLKALSKRAVDRYATAGDLEDDLRHFLRGDEFTESKPHAVTEEPVSQQPARIVPKGLRSFDAGDADFYLELLPGPCDRNGLPESIRFWKTRIEETDPDETFRVGLIYGPSGCGKSSLVKAGLLPRLANHVLPVYVEATAMDTEARLLKNLHKRCPSLPPNLDLIETLTELRRGRVIPLGDKILIVIDQFEQWLHATQGKENTALIQALRQCDGERLQCIVMVRDDFWMAATRCMRELDLRILEAENAHAVDLFPPRHAQNVLSAFGRAFGELPEDISKTTEEQQDFLKQAVNGLIEDGKVVCVRLALFAEMFKGKSWTPATLVEVGGTEGVGVTFLEETFSASTAPPEHRLHQKAARAVLKSLLPATGTDIKGGMRPYNDLLDASGYAQRPDDFRHVIDILDTQTRVITPTDPAGHNEEDKSNVDVDPAQKYYQLTHDFLVPLLREWLTKKQKETRRGRAELKLEERSAAWNAKPENRHLPGWWDFLNIRLLSDRKKWTPAQRRMMSRATKHYGQLGAVSLIVLIASVAALVYVIRQNSHARMVTVIDNLETCNPLLVYRVLQDLESFSDVSVKEELETRYKASMSEGNSEKDHLAFALAKYKRAEADYLASRIEKLASLECTNMIHALNYDRRAALTAIRSAANHATVKKGWRARARLAIVAAYLGNMSVADDMSENRPDPVQRTQLIAELADWHADLAVLAELVRASENGATRSAIALGIAGISSSSGEVNKAARDAWSATLAAWYGKPDSGTHSAAGLAMRRWEIELPPRQEMSQPPQNQDWWDTPLGLTMVKIPTGGVASEAHEIVVDKPFWLSDREISIALFKRFMAEAEPANRPDDWEGASTFGNKIDDNHPVQDVSWEDAVLFCNWLSRQHNLKERYSVDPFDKEKDRQQYQKYTVKLVPGADGFRLPTADEWEYGCRAGTTTDFSCGSDEQQLRAYAVFFRSKTEICGSLLCNGWGLFDMHGNVWEWCWDLTGGSNRVLRGGGWSLAAAGCRSSSRFHDDPTYRSNSLGFRLALVPSSEDAERQESSGKQEEEASRERSGAATGGAVAEASKE